MIIQYYFVSGFVKEIPESKDDGLIHRRVNQGPYRFWAMFNHISEEYISRKDLLKEFAINKDNAWKDWKMEEFDDDGDGPIQATTITRQNANKIMRKWRKLAKNYENA